MMRYYGVTTDYEYSATHKRERIDVWSKRFVSAWEAEGVSLPGRNGYMLTTYNGDKVRVLCPMRDDEHWQEADEAINAALNAYHDARGDVRIGDAQW